MNPFTVSVPASSSNFGSGFDTLSAALDVRLECRVSRRAERGVDWFGAPEPPADNVAHEALLAGCRHLGVESGDLQIRMCNPIPLSRGMGSSGAAIIAGLAIAHQLAGVRLESSEALRLACPLEGHPDNLAASLLGGWVLSCSRPDGVTAERIGHRLEGRFVLAIPQIEISTREARELLPQRVSLADAVFNQQRCALLVHALTADRPGLLSEATRDRWHQRWRARLIPGAEGLLDSGRWPASLRDALLSVTISGSGSTLIAFVQGKESEVAEWMLATLTAAGTAAEHLVTDLDTRGLIVD